MDLLKEKEKGNKHFFEKWDFVSDQVMGGVSDGNAKLISDKKITFLNLNGVVSTKNNGGFIQIRKKISTKKKYEGIRLKVRGTNDKYFVHVRTKSLFLPWQYYSADFQPLNSWSEIEIKFDDFKKSNFYQPSTFSSEDIKSVGFVAFGKDFNANLDVLEASLF